MDRLSQRFAGLIVDGIADGSIRPADPGIAAQMINGMISAGADLSRWVPHATPDDASILFAWPLFEGFRRPTDAGGGYPRFM